ncbi:MAG: hypothetical protein N2Z40_07620 [Caldimicrobium sp.]|nr:hypothetical protein [Caldimicrobium sp.]MCX7614064.1 hypothetical protein [Caldimicrobium sp.]MDW8182857.1 hypothetical protein [Caldimicrobium sp.]
MKRKGFLTIELLIVIILASVLSLALLSTFIVSNSAFKTGRMVSELTEDVRNAFTTLDYLFSRWGQGVPCADNNCTISSTLPDCTSYPPRDPMCVTISDNGRKAEFYANLYGSGFVESANNLHASIISCRLNSGSKQNCYYIFDNSGFRIRSLNNQPVAVKLSSFTGQPDCLMNAQPNLFINRTLFEWDTVSNSSILTLMPGDFIVRVPHRITLYVKNIAGENWLVYDRTDMENGCGDSENSVRIIRIRDLTISKDHRTVVFNATLITANGTTYLMERRFGR